MCPAVAYEMLMSRSPPVFSHSPPTSFLSEYTSFCLPSDKFLCNKRYQTPSRSLTFPAPKTRAAASTTMPHSPIRPCLVIRPGDNNSHLVDDRQLSPTKLKKRVVFADDKGMKLTHVRVMTEPSNVPPLWSFRFLAEVTQGMCAQPEVDNDSWEIGFQQPASDYLDFRKKLETQKVSLENVIVKENEEIIVGTIKVANLSFQKEVIVRVTSDEWKTHEDAFCNYVPNSLSGGSSAYVLYDTFSFKFAIPPRAKRLEFCVCYRNCDAEFWDNNNGNNYVMVKKQIVPTTTASNDNNYKQEKKLIGGGTKKCTDALRAKPDSWSEFASWNHLENSAPYW